MKITDNEKIGELRYLTVEFDRTELVASGGVISQGAAQRYLAKERPDLKIKKCGSFKLDSQANTVTMKVGVVDDQPEKPSIPGGSKTLLEDFEQIEKAVDGEAVPVSADFMKNQKLLNPGYDELKTMYVEVVKERQQYADDFDALLLDYKNRSDELKELQERCDALVGPISRDAHKYEELKAKYDALVIAVGKDAQKFSDLLVENEELKTENSDLREALHDGVDKEAKGQNDEVDGTVEPDIGDKEIKDIADAMSKPPSIKPFDGSPEVKTHLAS